MEIPEVSFPAALVLIGTIAYISFVSYESNIIESKDAKPYTTFGHPKKFFIDKIAGIMFRSFVPFNKLCHPLSHKKDDYRSGKENEHESTLKKIRSRLNIFEENTLHRPSCFLWNRLITKKDSKDFLVGGTVMIPRESNILVEWGLNSATAKSNGPDFGEDMPVEIEITCPASVIEGNVKFEGRGSGFRKFKTCKLEELKLSPSVPIMLYIHGGGFVVGATRDSSPYLMYSLSSHQAKEQKNDTAPPLILASVKYRLSPENPFPAGLVDCLSAAKYFFEKFPTSNIHISGFSAGGNFSSVVGLECVRKYPGRVKSIVAVNPVLLPRSYTTSSHMNSKSSSFCPSNCLPWLWAAYFQLGDFHDQESYNTELGKHELYQLGNVGSINPMLRLIYPQIDLPKELKLDSAPRIFVVTGSADPLRDDGDDLAECLKDEGANVVKYECRGSHGLSMMLDIRKWNEFTKAWSKVVWP